MVKNKPGLEFGLAALVMILLGPLGIHWVLALCAAPLPAWSGPLVRGLRAATFPAPLLWLGGVFVGLGGLILGLSRDHSAKKPVCLGLLVGAFLSWCDLERPRAQREHWLGLVCERGSLIVRELEVQRQARGAYPRDLNGMDLFTGAPGYPRFDYALDPEHGYELSVVTPLGGFNFDRLFYWPGRNYPGNIGGNPITRIGDWAYFHE